MTGFKYPAWQWVLQWMAATIAGCIIGAVIVAVVGMFLFNIWPVPVMLNPAYPFVMGIFLGVAVGGSIGSLQWLFLRRWISSPGLWIGATVIGWAICSVGLPRTSVGFWLGIAQWLVLRQSVRWSGAWILISSAAWSIGTVSGDALCNAICKPLGSGLAIPITQFVGWGIAAAITGIALYGLLRPSLARDPVTA